MDESLPSLSILAIGLYLSIQRSVVCIHTIEEVAWAVCICDSVGIAKNALCRSECEGGASDAAKSVLCIASVKHDSAQCGPARFDDATCLYAWEPITITWYSNVSTCL